MKPYKEKPCTQAGHNMTARMGRLGHSLTISPRKVIVRIWFAQKLNLPCKTPACKTALPSSNRHLDPADSMDRVLLGSQVNTKLGRVANISQRP
jgi:hypothetical protein